MGWVCSERAAAMCPNVPACVRNSAAAPIPLRTCFTALPLAAAAASFFCFSCKAGKWGHGGHGRSQRRAGSSLQPCSHTSHNWPAHLDAKQLDHGGCLLPPSCCYGACMQWQRQQGRGGQASGGRRAVERGGGTPGGLAAARAARHRNLQNCSINWWGCRAPRGALGARSASKSSRLR